MLTYTWLHESAHSIGQSIYLFTWGRTGVSGGRFKPGENVILRLEQVRIKEARAQELYESSCGFAKAMIANVSFYLPQYGCLPTAKRSCLSKICPCRTST